MATIDLKSGIVVQLRSGFTPGGKDGEGRHNNKGVELFYADAMTAGQLLPFEVAADFPSIVRLRAEGTLPPFGDGERVRLTGRVLLRAYYLNAGRDKRSGIQIEAQRVEAADADEAPLFEGGLPVELPSGVRFRYYSQQAASDSDKHSGYATFGIVGDDPMYKDADNGLVRAACMTKIVGVMPGTEARPVELRAFFTAPDRQDVSASRKAELKFACRGVEAPVLVGANNGHRPGKRTEQTPPAEHTPSEG